MDIHTLFPKAKWNKLNFRFQLVRILHVLVILTFFTSLVGVQPAIVEAAPTWRLCPSPSTRRHQLVSPATAGPLLLVQAAAAIVLRSTLPTPLWRYSAN